MCTTIRIGNAICENSLNVNHTKHINTFCCQKNINVKGPVIILTTVLEGLRAIDSSSLLGYSSFVT